jgi:GWxTD domain-containing protein
MDMKHFVWVVLLLGVTMGHAQPLRDINFNYLYDQNQPVTLALRVVRTADGFVARYKLQWKDTSRYTLHWELRNTLGEKEGTPVDAGQVQEQRAAGFLSGTVTLPLAAGPVLVARAVNESAKKAWLFSKILETHYPVNAHFTAGNTDLWLPYVGVSQPVAYQGPGSSGGLVTVAYYNDDFPAAAPAFSETQARVSKGMQHDSVFTVTPGQPLSLSGTGLYLFQQDTTSAEAVAFRVEDDYPRLGKIESLADPLIYVCTKQEFDRVKAAKGDKKAFDRVILGVTGDAERARTFMRSYFRRVELANQYFTSYKEGWKTDRGMIYIVFGLPEEVHKTADREVWIYKNADFKVTFSFAKSGTIFDPDNFVLIRDKKYQNDWYAVIDLWRNARF